ncbi:HINFP-like protein, partial [Mya arenaria]
MSPSRLFIVLERRCHWRECRSEIDEEAVYYVRHLYFHLFHEKIKCVGTLLLAKTGRENCLFDTQSRNMVPELPESFVRLENADQFYKHVQSHTDCYPDGNHVTGGCKCLWQGCAMCVKSRHKLRDHLKSHTQEKVVACPTCGALFSCRTKFFDHLTRQPGYST